MCKVIGIVIEYHALELPGMIADLISDVVRKRSPLYPHRTTRVLFNAQRGQLFRFALFESVDVQSRSIYSDISLGKCAHVIPTGILM